MKTLFRPLRKAARAMTSANARASIAVPPMHFRCVACGRQFKQVFISAHRRPDDLTRCQGFVS